MRSHDVPKLQTTVPSRYAYVDQVAIDKAGQGGVWNHLAR